MGGCIPDTDSASEASGWESLAQMIPRGSSARTILERYRHSESTVYQKLRKAFGEYSYQQPLIRHGGVWTAERKQDGMPVVLKQIRSRDNGLASWGGVPTPRLDCTELWASILVHRRRVPHAIPVIDVFIDHCRFRWDVHTL